MRKASFLVVPLLLAAAPLAAQVVFKETRTGTLTYPALDNLDFREGTFECWVKLAFDPAELLPAKDYTGFVVLVQLHGESGGMNIHYSAQPNDSVASWWCSIGPKPKFVSMGIGQVEFKKDEWHHIALVWKGAEMKGYVDGKELSTRVQNSPLTEGFGPVGSKPIFLGDKWNFAALMVIDDFRLSRIARKPEELGYHGPLKPDPYTSILDGYEADFEPDGKQTTRPAVIHGGEGGLPSEQCQFVEGKFGKGLCFFKSNQE